MVYFYSNKTSTIWHTFSEEISIHSAFMINGKIVVDQIKFDSIGQKCYIVCRAMQNLPSKRNPSSNERRWGVSVSDVCDHCTQVFCLTGTVRTLCLIYTHRIYTNNSAHSSSFRQDSVFSTQDTLFIMVIIAWTFAMKFS